MELTNFLPAQSFFKSVIENITEHFFISLGIIVIGYIVKIILARSIHTIITKVEDDDPETTTALEARAYTLEGLANNIVDVGFIATTFLMILSEWGINIGPLLAGAGILGLAVGFGTQTLVKDIVTGFFILLENQFNVGDKITIAGVEGKVVAINLRTTVLKEKGGTFHIIPNSKVTDIAKDKYKIPSKFKSTS